MKLVNILARELKVWPEGVDSVWQSSCDNEIYFDADVRPFYTSLNAEDSGTRGAVITQAQWQAAVDALNAPKVVEWDGVSLPEKGTAVEVRFSREKIGSEWPWHSGIVVASSPKPEGSAMVAVEANGFTIALRVASDSIRPARTAEQVAAEEREAEDNEVMSRYISLSDCQKGMLGHSPERAIIGLMRVMGYRKEPKPCGS